MEYVSCNLCGSDRDEVYLIRRDLTFMSETVYRLVRCTNCGLVYLNPRPTMNELILLYPDDYDQYTIAVDDEPSFINRLDRRYGLYKRCRAILRYKRRGRLLDVGCATGDFLDAMRHYPGWEVYGIELNEVASEYARQRLGLTVCTGTIESVKLPNNWFDVVTLWNVLEHLYDPLSVMQKIHRLLRPDGLLVINTPNLDSLDARIFGPYWIGYELPRHLYVFSRSTLGRLINETGFSVVEMRCLYGSHAATMSGVRFLLRAKANAKWRKLLEWLLFARVFRVLVSPFFFLLDHLLLSTQLTVFCRKILK